VRLCQATISARHLVEVLAASLLAGSEDRDPEQLGLPQIAPLDSRSARDWVWCGALKRRSRKDVLFSRGVIARKTSSARNRDAGQRLD
jgi:hypothetical protein